MNVARRSVDERLDGLARVVLQGGPNRPLIRRAKRIADEMTDAPDLAAQLRTALLSKRGESLGDRYDRLNAIRKQYAELR